MSRFKDFTARERIVLWQALQEASEKDEDVELKPWADVAESLQAEIEPTREDREQGAALNAEGEALASDLYPPAEVAAVLHTAFTSPAADRWWQAWKSAHPDGTVAKALADAKTSVRAAFGPAT